MSTKHGFWTRKRALFAGAILAFAMVAGIAAAHNAAGTHPADARATTMHPATAVTAPAPSPETQAGLDLARGLSDAFEHASGLVSPAVVPIFAEQTAPQQMSGQMQLNPFGEEFFRRFFGGQLPPGFGGEGEPQEIHSMGSGVIVSKDGYILTNHHVVDGAQKLTILLGKDERLDAKVVGTDPETDVAVIKVNADHDLPVAQLGDSEGLRVGQWVIAVGNPFQLLSTVTAGIVSATGRSEVGLATYENFIQTDASINPGNSGGALADLEGRVIGINTAITTPSGGNVGIGFAIPINMARRVMDDLIANGEVSRGYLALVPQDIDEGLASALKLPSRHGALVAEVEDGGPAAKAGVRSGDVIVGFAGHEVLDSADLRRQVAQEKPGSEVQLDLRRDGRHEEVKVKLGERPHQAAQVNGQGGSNESEGRLGLAVESLTPQIARQLGLEDDAKGVVVDQVAPGSAAAEAGLQRGDVITKVNNEEVTSPQELRSQVAKYGSGESVAFLVRRGGRSLFVGVEIP